MQGGQPAGAGLLPEESEEMNGWDEIGFGLYPYEYWTISPDRDFVWFFMLRLKMREAET